ncbi:MAG: EamA family transporter, partial [Chroococcidiopsidaceae cyanobacterium CP_BM_ER_R8_30]|nr:EamA family transporter [Chroococcidiopsidaceae cyanobacterium CP_BM_ER_R8_30]
SSAGAFNPIAAALGAYLLLGEVPTPAQYFGGSVVLIGIMLSQIGTWLKPSLTASKSNHPQKMETGVGFKGL